jgi:heme O synthase-like polyprenyltransferase
MNENNWNSGLTRGLIDFYLGKVLGKLSRLSIYLITLMLFFFGITLPLSEKTQFIIGVIFMYLADVIMSSHVLFGVVRGHISQQSRKKAMKLQYFAVLIITFIFIFVLE